MAEDDAAIRPETSALDALIRETVSRRRQDGTPSTADALLFLGNGHYAVPALVVHDPVLEPVDKLIWMVIYQRGRGMGVTAVFPGYTEIARLANVASTATVARAIAILRATRWLSLCVRGRDAGGRFSGNVYALHDEPLPLADALHLDPDYMAFLQAARRHHHARVRRIAAALCASLDADIRAGKDVLAPVNLIERRLEALHAIHQGGGRRYFSFSAAILSSLANTGAEHEDIDQDQNSKAVPRSSKDINKTTTTTKTDSERAGRTSAALGNLIFPAHLEDNQRALAMRYLAQVPVEHRQAVLDELEGRLQAARHGAKPVYDALRYLHHLCAEASRGGFHPNLGLKVQGARERRRREAERSREEAAAHERKRQARAPRPPGESPLAEMRKKLGLPPAPGRKPR